LEGIRKLVNRWTKCIEKEGDYIEKWCTCSTLCSSSILHYQTRIWNWNYVYRCYEPRKLLYDVIPRLSSFMKFFERDAYRVLDGKLVYRYTCSSCIIIIHPWS
jgi:hypothetical protein